MTTRKIIITADQAALGDAWEHVDRYCELLETQLRRDFDATEVVVMPERKDFNGGHIELQGEWEGAEDDARALIADRSETILADAVWQHGL